MAVKDYENIVAIVFVGTIGLGALFMGVQPEIIAVGAVSGLVGFIGGKATNIVGGA